MRTSKDFVGEPDTIAAARRLAETFLRRLGAGGVPIAEQSLHKAQLVVSELITNAVRHTAGPCGLELELTGQILQITVWDTSPLLPVVMDPSPSRIGGHGMEIVTALCGRLRVLHRGIGKQITVRLALTD